MRTALAGDAGADTGDGIARLVLAVRPEMAVVWRVSITDWWPEAALDGLDQGALGDEQGGVEVPDVVEGRPLR